MKEVSVHNILGEGCLGLHIFRALGEILYALIEMGKNYVS